MRDTQSEWMSAMRQGNYRGAWAISDAVLARRDPARRDDPALPYHQRWVWDGSPVSGRRVLVRCYHGLGDTLQFVRYLPALRTRAVDVELEVQPELIPLLQSSQVPGSIIPFRPDSPSSRSECDVEIMELAHALRLPPEAAPPPYLGASSIPLQPESIGVCWEAGGWDADRSIPESLLSPLLTVGLPVLSLCPGKLPAGFAPSVCPLAIDETASLLAGLDLIITVDTMIAHLAGAMGLPTWLLLKHQPDWRWQSGGCARHEPVVSAWYPSVTLFRQPSPGDWAAVINTIANRLVARLRQARGRHR